MDIKDTNLRFESWFDISWREVWGVKLPDFLFNRNSDLLNDGDQIIIVNEMCTDNFIQKGKKSNEVSISL